MSVALYPGELAVSAADWLFTVRYPWLEELQACMQRNQPACLTVPKIAGTDEDWACWLRDYLWSSGFEVQHVPGVFPAALLQYFAIEPPEGIAEGSSPWAATALTSYRDRVGTVQPYRVILESQYGLRWEFLDNWLRAQERTGIHLICPIVVAPRPVGGNLLWTVRFGAPEALGNLQSIKVFPDKDSEEWTRLYLMLTAMWECGGIPHLAEELWTVLRYEMVQIVEPDFDVQLADRLDDFAQHSCFQSLAKDADELIRRWGRPRAVRCRKLDSEDETLWQQGVLTWYNPRADLTPLACRVLMADDLDTDDYCALRRRRLVNSPVARWLSAWSSTVEESLRLAVLNIGDSSFRRFLTSQGPFDHRFSSRLEELRNKGNKAERSVAVDLAEFIDLEEFLSQQPESTGVRQSLRRCRIARNEIIHERVSSADAIRSVTSVLQWLNSQALV